MLESRIQVLEEKLETVSAKQHLIGIQPSSVDACIAELLNAKIVIAELQTEMEKLMSD